MVLCAAVEQHDNQQAQQNKGYVPQDAPRQGGMVGEPLVLGHHAQQHTDGRQGVHSDGQVLLALYLVTLTPDVVQQHIKDGHGDGGDPLAQAQGNSVVLQAGGAQSQCTRYQVEGIAGTQHHSHEAEQLELRTVLAATDHADAHRENGGQIKDVKYSFNDCTHRFLLLFQIGSGGIFM